MGLFSACVVFSAEYITVLVVRDDCRNDPFVPPRDSLNDVQCLVIV